MDSFRVFLWVFFVVGCCNWGVCAIVCSGLNASPASKSADTDRRHFFMMDAIVSYALATGRLHVCFRATLRLRFAICSERGELWHRVWIQRKLEHVLLMRRLRKDPPRLRWVRQISRRWIMLRWRAQSVRRTGSTRTKRLRRGIRFFRSK